MTNESYDKYGYCKGIDAKTGKIIYGYFAFLPYTTYCFKEDYEAHPENDKEYIVTCSMMDWGLPNNINFNLIKPGSMRPYLGRDKNSVRIFYGDRVKWTVKVQGEDLTLHTTIFLNDWIRARHNDYWNQERQVWLSECELMQDGLQEVQNGDE